MWTVKSILPSPLDKINLLEAYKNCITQKNYIQYSLVMFDLFADLEECNMWQFSRLSCITGPLEDVLTDWIIIRSYMFVCSALLIWFLD